MVLGLIRVHCAVQDLCPALRVFFQGYLPIAHCVCKVCPALWVQDRCVCGCLLGSCPVSGSLSHGEPIIGKLGYFLLWRAVLPATPRGLGRNTDSWSATTYSSVAPRAPRGLRTGLRLTNNWLQNIAVSWDNWLITWYYMIIRQLTGQRILQNHGTTDWSEDQHKLMM